MYLVTGGAGFIGSHIAHRLVREGRPVRVLDSFSGRQACQPGRHPRRYRPDRGRYPRRRYRSAGRAGRRSGLPRGRRALRTEVHRRSRYDDGRERHGHAELLMAARDAGCRRFVLASTAPSMVTRPSRPRSSRCRRRRCRRTRSRSSPVSSCARSLPAPTASRRSPCGTLTSSVPARTPIPPMPPRSHASWRRLASGKRPTVFGDGEQSRDFVYVEDVVKANFLAASVPGIAGRVFNVASGRSVTVNQVLAR